MRMHGSYAHALVGGAHCFFSCAIGPRAHGDAAHGVRMGLVRMGRTLKKQKKQDMPLIPIIE